MAVAVVYYCLSLLFAVVYSLLCSLLYLFVYSFFFFIYFIVIGFFVIFGNIDWAAIWAGNVVASIDLLLS